MEEKLARWCKEQGRGERVLGVYKGDKNVPLAQRGGERVSGFSKGANPQDFSQKWRSESHHSSKFIGNLSACRYVSYMMLVSSSMRIDKDRDSATIDTGSAQTGFVVQRQGTTRAGTDAAGSTVTCPPANRRIWSPGIYSSSGAR